MHSFSHLNFCGGAILRDQQHDVAQTKCAGSSEHQLFAEAPGAASANTSGSPQLPAAHQAQTLPGWSQGTLGEPLLLPPVNLSSPL